METDASRNPDQVHAGVLLQARQACYKARDAFYACLDKASGKNPTEIGTVGLLYPVECKSSGDEFQKNCRATSVKHFDRNYCENKSVQRLLDDKDSRRAIISGLYNCFGVLLAEIISTCWGYYRSMCSEYYVYFDTLRSANF